MAMKPPPPPPTEPLYMVWNNVGITYNECRLACALSIYVQFEDGTSLDDTTIGQIVGAPNGLENLDLKGLVDHLRQNDNVFPEVLAGGEIMAAWARNAWRKWLDPCASRAGCWP